MTEKLEDTDLLGNDSKVLRYYDKVKGECSIVIAQIIREGNHNNIEDFKDNFILEILENSKFSFLIALFPQLRLLEFYLTTKRENKVKAIYCNINKFISPVNLLFPGLRNKKGYELDCLKKSIIFIDEVDSCHEIMLNTFIEEELNSEGINLLKDIIEVLTRFVNKDLTNIEANESLKAEFIKIQKEINKSLFQKYEGSLRSNFNMNDENKDFSVLFYSSKTKDSYIEINDDKKVKFYYNSTENPYSKNKNGYLIFDDPKSLDLENKNIEFINSLIFDLKRCLGLVTSRLFNQTKFLRERSLKKQAVEENASSYIRSAVINFTGKNSVMYNYMLGQINDIHQIYRLKSNQERKFSPLYNGLYYYYYENNIDNLTNVELKELALSNTPERILYILANKAAIIPLSATANITTRYGNFDFNEIYEWMQESGKNYFLTDDEKELAQKEYRLKSDNYNNINLKAYILSPTNPNETDLNSDGEADIYFKKLIDKEGSYDITTPKKRGLSYICKQIDRLNTEDDDKNDGSLKFGHRLKELKGILKAFSLFINEGGEAVLMLNSFNIVKYQELIKSQNNSKDYNGEIYIEALKDIFDIIISVEKPELIDKVKIYQANSKKYQKVKKKLDEDYNKGYKVILFTTYQSMNTGQNASIKIPDKKTREKNNNYRQYIEPNKNGIYSKARVDFNFIYMGSITRLGTRASEIIKASTFKEYQKNLLKYTYILEKAQSLYEISNNTKKEKIKSIFHNVSSKKGDPYENGYELQKLAAIIQSIGRISRNSLKEKNIIITSIKDNINKAMYDDYCKSNIILKEMANLYRIADFKMSDKEFKYLILGEEEKSLWLAKKLELISKTAIREIEEDRRYYDTIRFKKDPQTALFPFFNEKIVSLSQVQLLKIVLLKN